MFYIETLLADHKWAFLVFIKPSEMHLRLSRQVNAQVKKPHSNIRRIDVGNWWVGFCNLSISS